MDHDSLALPWLLIAAPQMTDGNFKRAVVLIVEHTDEGAMGFVINRPLQTSLASVIEHTTLQIPENIPVWYGGPVAAGNGIIVHTPPTPPPDNRTPAQIVMTANQEGLEDLISQSEQIFGALQHPPIHGASGQPNLDPLQFADSTSPGENKDLFPYRFIVGYSGWGAGQLEEEIREGIWLQIPSTHGLVFRCPWNQVWDEAYAAIGMIPREYAPSASHFLN